MNGVGWSDERVAGLCVSLRSGHEPARRLVQRLSWRC